MLTKFVGRSARWDSDTISNQIQRVQDELKLCLQDLEAIFNNSVNDVKELLNLYHSDSLQEEERILLARSARWILQNAEIIQGRTDLMEKIGLEDFNLHDRA